MYSSQQEKHATVINRINDGHIPHVERGRHFEERHTFITLMTAVFHFQLWFVTMNTMAHLLTLLATAVPFLL